jgi:undecaprenyl-phosphate 4-deoxy-4-formamido-L-arabinose transferase
MSQQDKCDISVVVPVYAGVSILDELYQRVASTLISAGRSFELILVDDRGNQASWDAILRLTGKDTRVRGIRLTRNFGQHAATLCGVSHARGQWVVTMDEDLEHLPEAIPELIHACDDQHPLVYGIFEKRTHGWYRNASSELMRLMLKKAFPQMNEDYTSFRAMRLPLARQLSQFDLNQPYIDGMLSWITSNTRTVLVTHGERKEGRSTYTLHKLIAHALNIFITFSSTPLRVASYCGAFIAFSSFFYIAYLVAAYLLGYINSPGYTSVMSVTLFACGIQLMILGIVGEYIGRLMGATYRKPVFVIDTITGSDNGRTGQT